MREAIIQAHREIISVRSNHREASELFINLPDIVGKNN